jgi:hypothetical protein
LIQRQHQNYLVADRFRRSFFLNAGGQLQILFQVFPLGVIMTIQADAHQRTGSKPLPLNRRAADFSQLVGYAMHPFPGTSCNKEISGAGFPA